MQYTEKGLLEIVDFGKSILEEYRGQPTDDFKTPTALMVLLHLEHVLDSGRVLVDMGDPHIKAKVNKGRDEIQDGIVALMKRIGKSDVGALLRSGGESFKTNFIEAAFSERTL